MDTFGARLLAFLDAVDMEVKDFAGTVGVELGTVYRYFHNEREPKASVLVSMEGKVGVSASWLLCGNGQMFASNAVGAALQEKHGIVNGQKSLPFDTQNKAHRYSLVREWLTATGSFTEWYFLVQENVEGVTMQMLLSLEGKAVLPEEVAFTEDFYKWLYNNGIQTEWLFGVQSEPFTDDEQGKDLCERLRGRFRKKGASPRAGANPLQYSEQR